MTTKLGYAFLSLILDVQTNDFGLFVPNSRCYAHHRGAFLSLILDVAQTHLSLFVPNSRCEKDFAMPFCP